jgi:hypothetical protein
MWEYCEVIADVSARTFNPGAVEIWEYKVDGKHKRTNTEKLGVVLAELGFQNWELVISYPVTVGTVVQNYRVVYVFKRPVSGL